MAHRSYPVSDHSPGAVACGPDAVAALRMGEVAKVRDVLSFDRQASSIRDTTLDKGRVRSGDLIVRNKGDKVSHIIEGRGATRASDRGEVRSVFQ